MHKVVPSRFYHSFVNKVKSTQVSENKKYIHLHLQNKQNLNMVISILKSRVALAKALVFFFKTKYLMHKIVNMNSLN